MNTNRLIEEKYWSQFIKIGNSVKSDVNPSGKRIKAKHDGQRFEDLIEELLNLEYKHIIWNRTKTTHDGNKDFIGVCDNETFWAECKNYKTKIDLKTLAATLVMAEIQYINSIFFFCYSEINKNTKTKLNSFAVTNGKNIFFFDGIVLDQLILKYREKILPKYFPQYYEEVKDQKIFATKYQPIALCYVERTPFLNGVADFDMQSLSEIQNLKFGEIIGLHIIIINTNLTDSIKCSIELAFSDGEFFWELLDKKEYKNNKILYDNIELEAGLTKKTTFYLRLQSHNSKVSLPQIICKFEKKIIDKFSFATITTLKTRQTALIGRNYVEKKEYLCKSCVNQKNLSIIYIYGSSGTGKSRFASECSISFVANGYHILKLVNSKQSSHSTYTMLKELIFALYGLNDELIEYVVHNSFDELEEYSRGTDKEVLKIIKNIHDSCNDMSKINDLDYTAIYEKMAKGNYFILVDDIQYWDDCAITFLRDFYIYALSLQRKCNVVMSIVANTDVLYNQHTIEFLAELESQNTDFDKNIYSVNIKGFETPNQSYMFLKEILGMDDNFEEVAELTTFSQNPKYLAEVVNYLWDIRAIDVISNKVIIADKEFLKASLTTLPQSINSLISARWSRYLERFEDKDATYKEIISCILLLGNIEIRNNSLGKEFENEIRELYSYGFLKKLDYQDNSYVFEHDIIKFFFQNYYTDWFETSLSYLDEMDCKDGRTIWSDCVCTLYKSQSITLKDYNHYVNLDISNDIRYKMNMYILNSALKNKTDDTFFIVQGILQNTREQFGENKVEPLYKLFDTTYDFTCNLLKSDEYCIILMAYAENQLKLKKTEHSLQLYDKILAIIERYPLDNNEYMKAEIYNRYFVCGRVGGSINQYLEKYNLSLELSLKNEFWDIYIENYFDRAHSLFLSADESLLAISLLEKGCSAYVAHEPLGMKGQYLYRNIQLGFLKRDYTTLGNTIWKYEEQVLNDSEIKFKLFFRIQFLIFKIMFCLMGQCKYNDFEMKNMLNQLNRFQTMQNTLQLYRYYYLSAKYYSQKELWEKAFLFYQKTFDSLGQNKYTEELSLQKSIIARDMIINFRKRKFPFKKFDMSCFDLEIQDAKFTAIMLCSDEEFEKYFNSYIPQTPVFNEDTKEGYILF